MCLVREIMDIMGKSDFKIIKYNNIFDYLDYKPNNQIKSLTELTNLI